MTSSMEALLTILSGNKELSQKFTQLDQISMIAAAKELGITLTEADFAPADEGEISENELETVAGGKECYCAIGGGGTSSNKNEDTCGCAIVGVGMENKKDTHRCLCNVGGYGYEMEA